MLCLLLRLITLYCLSLLLMSPAIGGEKIEVDLIMGGAYVVTMDKQQPVIRHGAVAIRAGNIIDVDSREKITARYRASQQLAGSGMILMPGLINGHTHAAMTLFRGLADDIALMEWLQHNIFPAEARFVDADFVRIGTQLACWEMIRGGITTFVDNYFYPDVIARVTEQCGLRAIIGAPVIDFPSPGFKGWNDSFAAARAFVRQWKHHRLITPAIAPHAPYTVKPEHLKAASDVTRQLGVPMTIHVSETAHEVDEIKQRYGKRPVEHLEAYGVLNPSLITAHMVWPDANEIKLLATRGVSVIHNPGSNMKLASGFAPVPEMLKAGVKLGLGTDGAASNNDLDMWEEIRLTALIHKGHLLDPTVLPAAEVLRMATLGGAEAIGLADKIGAITVGRRADLIQVRVTELAHALPLYNVISHLVYSVKSSDIVNVVVDGRILMRNQVVLTVDQRAVAVEANRLSLRIKRAITPTH